MSDNNFNERVFSVRDPPCAKCQENDLDFCLHEDSNGSGFDLLQWSCKNSSCGHKVCIELL